MTKDQELIEEKNFELKNYIREQHKVINQQKKQLLEKK